MKNTSTNYSKAFATLTSLFFMWGFITVLVDFLIPRLREIFDIGNFEAGLVQFAFFIAYGLISIPAGLLLQRIGYKKGIIIGLLVMGVGCGLFFPAAAFRMFPVFLLAYFTLAGGMTILQVAANPYVTVLGSAEGASSRLNLAQAFNSLGTALAPIVGATYLLSDKILSKEEISTLSETAKENYFNLEAEAVQAPFMILALVIILLAIITKIIPLPQVLSDSASNYKKVLQNKKLILGALGIFVYVGAEVAIGSYATLYFMDLDLVEMTRNSEVMKSIFDLINSGNIMTIDGKGVVGAFVFFYWSGAMVGRFVGAYLTKFHSPNKILFIFGTIAILLLITTFATTGFVAMWTLLAIGLFNSIMFPTIFAIAIEDLGDLKPEGSGILCTAIAGGAFIPPMYGLMADNFGYKIGFILLILCYAYITYYGKTSKNINV